MQTSLACAGQFHPMAIRGTGIGWASGVGHLGAIAAPVVIGVPVGMALPLQQNFIAIGRPGLIAAIAISLVDHRRSASPPQLQPGPVASVPLRRSQIVVEGRS